MPGKHLRQITVRLAVALCLLCTALTGWAANKNDPINIEADSAELKEDFSVYTGSVRLTQGGMVLTGDQLVVRKGSNGNYSLTLTGRPANIYQPAADQGGDPIRGRAHRIEYGSGQEILELRGDANIDRGGESISGESIRYNVRARSTLVNNEGGADGGRVKITLQPGK